MEIGGRVLRLVAQRGLCVGPDRRHPGADLGAGQEVPGELLAPGPQLGGGLQVVDELQDAGIEGLAHPVASVVGHVVEHGPHAIEQPFEDPVFHRSTLICRGRDGPG